MYSRKFQSIRPDIAQLKGNSIYLLSKHSSPILTFLCLCCLPLKIQIVYYVTRCQSSQKKILKDRVQKNIKNGLWQRLFFDPNDHIFFLLFSDETTEALTTVSEQGQHEAICQLCNGLKKRGIVTSLHDDVVDLERWWPQPY